MVADSLNVACWTVRWRDICGRCRLVRLFSRIKWKRDTLGACVEAMQEADARNKSRQKINAGTEKRLGELAMQCRVAKEARKASWPGDCR